MSIQIPSELVRNFANKNDTVRSVSYFYQDIDRLFPGNLPGENK